MSKFGEPQECRNSCGQLIYFDRNSEKGHPTADKWIPLQYDKESGIKTDEPHNCPKSPFYVVKQQQPQQQPQQPQQHQVQIPATGIPQETQVNLALEIKLLSQKIQQLNEKVDKIVLMLERQQGAVTA